MKRFVSADPIGLAGGVNAYAYVGNDPARFADPSGLFVDTVADIGFVIYDIYRLIKDNLINDCGNFDTNISALGADVLGFFAPGATGLGLGVRAAAHTPKGLANPFRGKTPEEIDKMLRAKGYRASGPDPVNGYGGYVNPKTGRSYHIDPKEYGRHREPNHVDVNRPRNYSGNLPKRKYPF